MKIRSSPLLFCAIPLLIAVVAHLCVDASSEPFYNNDETRHVMTGVFVRDALADCPAHPKDYAVRYYLQYPALGLVVWPPFFYGVEGAWMSIFGTSFLAARLLVALFVLLAGFWFFSLVSRTHEPITASLSLLILGLSPLVFQFSRQVMLEIPALALALGAIFHFERYLDEQRRRDAWFACLLAALTALTRFDGGFLLPYFAIRLLMTRRWGLLKRGSVLGGVGIALLLTVPYYVWTWLEYGSAIAKAVKSGTGANSTSFLDSRNLLFYPSCVPEQIGWFASIAAILGMLFSLRRTSRPYFAMLVSTYLFFTPLAELEARHAIYWIPALAVFAVLGCAGLARMIHRRRLMLPLVFVVGIGTFFSPWRDPAFHVVGYEEAAAYVVENNRETPVCLVDGFLNGNFIYQVRRHDPDRRLWVLRGDKLFYSMLSDPRAAYADWVKEERDMLAAIERFDPELIVVEEPQLYFELRGATLLRQTLHDHPERFRLEKTVPIRSNHIRFAGARLEIWRNLVRNPNRSENLQIEMLGLGRPLRTDMKK